MTEVTEHGSHRRVLARWAGAVALWLLLSLSLGWYYTFTYYGHMGWPVPAMDSCLALLLYYFSVLNVQTEIQALHWVLVFPLAGILWVAALWHTAPRFGERRVSFDAALLAFAAASLPLILPAGWMTEVAGRTDHGFVWGHMLLVALRRAWVTPWWWLNPLYAVLGLVTFFGQVAAYRRAFAVRGKRAWLHFCSGAILATLAACVIAALAALPLRAWLE